MTGGRISRTSSPVGDAGSRRGPRSANRYRTVRLRAIRSVRDVRRLIVTGTLIVGLAVAAVAAASTPPVPLHAQRAIKQRTKLYAYVPARVPIGFRYYRWSFTPKPPALRVVFRNKAGWEIVFSASPGAACAGAGKEKTFQLDGNKVYWSHTATSSRRGAAWSGGTTSRSASPRRRPFRRRSSPTPASARWPPRVTTSAREVSRAFRGTPSPFAKR
jgi:hypothetical protein